MSRRTIRTERERTIHHLKINGYSATKAHSCSYYISSDRLAAGGYDWEVRCYPNYYELERRLSWIALQLVFHSRGCRDEVKAALSCELSAVDPSLNISYGNETEPYKYTRQAVCGPPLLLIPQKDLGTFYLRDDSFVVECSITVLREPQRAMSDQCSIVHPRAASDPCCDLHLHFGELLLSQMGADITLVVSGESFLAHKAILAARSPVFMAEFFGHMKESSSGTVEIKDMAAPAFRAMLNFIYTGTVPELDQHYVGDMEHEVTTMAHHLLAAADRYGLERLKQICMNKLIEGMNVETAATTLALAEQHSCSQLKAKCIQFIVTSPENLDAVMETEGYKLILASCPSLLNTLLRAAVARGK